MENFPICPPQQDCQHLAEVCLWYSFYFKHENTLFNKISIFFESGPWGKLCQMTSHFRSSWISRIALLKEKFIAMHSNLSNMLQVNILCLRKIVIVMICFSLPALHQGNWTRWVFTNVTFDVRLISHFRKCIDSLKSTIWFSLITNAMNYENMLFSKYYLSFGFRCPTKHA